MFPRDGISPGSLPPYCSSSGSGTFCTCWVIPWIELIAGILHIYLFIIYSGVTDSPQQLGFCLLRLTTGGLLGWTNNFYCQNLSLIVPTWAFVGGCDFLLKHFARISGFEVAVNLSEEVRRAKMAAPKVMFWAIACSDVLACACGLVVL